MRLLVAGLLAVAASLALPSTAQAAPGICAGSDWVGSWAAAPSDGKGVNFVRPLVAQSVRMIVNPTLSGDTVRVRLSHRYGASTARISSATVGIRAQGAAIVPGTLRRLTFGGSGQVDLPAGQDVHSDPTDVPVEAGQDLVVSLHVPGLVAQPTEHFITNQRSYLSLSGHGDKTSSISGAGFVLPTSTVYSNGWYFLEGLDVRAPGSTGAVVAFGDSITDGFQGSSFPILEGRNGWDANARYPDFLARRLQAMTSRPRTGVLNSGISGNQILADAATPYPYGVSALERFHDDAIAIPGVTDVIILEGINDLGSSGDVTANEVIAGLRRLVETARSAGLRVHLGTLTPASGAAGEHGTPRTEVRRQAVNHWIRTSDVAHSVVDFDEALRDPAQPSRLLPAYDSGDRLHPSTDGYRAMADAVSLHQLKGSRCA